MITKTKINQRLRGIYINMISRCYNPINPNFKYYGAKGIRVCQQWIDDRTSFYSWAIDNGYSDNLEIDRIKNRKGYEPNNCRWVTKKENLANREFPNVYIEFRGNTYHLRDLCEKYNLSYSGAYDSLITHRRDIEDYVFRKGNQNLRKKLNAALNFYQSIC